MTGGVGVTGVAVGPVGVAVGVALGVTGAPVGEGVAVGQAPPPPTVALPPCVLAGMLAPSGSPKLTLVKSRELKPSQEVVNVTRASTPLPVGPGGDAPNDAQPKETSPSARSARSGPKHWAVRPVLSRNSSALVTER